MVWKGDHAENIERLHEQQKTFEFCPDFVFYLNSLDLHMHRIQKVDIEPRTKYIKSNSNWIRK